MKKITLFIVLCSFIFAATKAQNISTFAGNGSTGNTGNGGAAKSATFYNPYGVCADTSGNIYIADQWNNLVRVVNTSGIISVFAGTGTAGYAGDNSKATLAELNYPSQVYADAAGNVYIADEFNNVIRKVNKAGLITTVAGNNLGGYSSDGGQATATELNSPTDVTFDAKGNMYIADYSNQRVRKVNTGGVISTFAGTGSVGYSGDNGPATSAELNYPYGVTVTPDGSVYVSDTYNNRIRKIDTNGTITTFAGNGTAGYMGDNGAATSAEINNPFKVNSDPAGNIYIADFGNSVIRFINRSTHIISTIAGDGTAGYAGDGGPAIDAELSQAGGVFPFSKNKTVYIGDNLNERVRMFTFAPLGIDNIEGSQIASVKLYPDPSTGRFSMVTLNLHQRSTVDIYSLLGTKVYSSVLNSETTSFDLSAYAAGVYFYKVITENGSLISEGKFILEK